MRGWNLQQRKLYKVLIFSGLWVQQMEKKKITTLCVMNAYHVRIGIHAHLFVTHVSRFYPGNQTPLHSCPPCQLALHIFHQNHLSSLHWEERTRKMKRRSFQYKHILEINGKKQTNSLLFQHWNITLWYRKLSLKLSTENKECSSPVVCKTSS